MPVAETEMVALRLVCLKHGHKVAEALTAAQLPEHQRQQLVPACKAVYVGITPVLPDKASEFGVVKILCHLCENVFVPVHLQPPSLLQRYSFKSAHTKNFIVTI